MRQAILLCIQQRQATRDRIRELRRRYTKMCLLLPRNDDVEDDEEAKFRRYWGEFTTQWANYRGDAAEAADGEAGVDDVGPADDISKVVNVFDAVI